MEISWNKLIVGLHMFCLLVSTEGKPKKAAINTNGTREHQPWEKYHFLPSDVRPSLYQMQITPNLEEGIYSGQTSISVTLNEPRSFLVLHASSNLNISRTEIILNETQIPLNETLFYKPNDFYVIRFKEILLPGEYKIHMDFNGHLTGQLNSFYRSKYYDSKDNVTRYLATTKFEPHYARRTFPCFDEPSFKAKFQIDIVVPTEKNYTTLSNMEEKERIVDSPNKGFTIHRFSRSPAMPTYIVCMTVGIFSGPEPATTDKGVTVRTFARPGHEQRMVYARDTAVSAVQFFEEYLGVKYTLSKLDLIALPDFGSGAMENWGLVTFRELSAMISKGSSSVSDYWSVTKTICHEIAHMWFGNLVTMKWWDNIWLNEGFATFMAAKCVQNLMPHLNDEEIEMVRKTHGVLAFDSALSSHPILHNVSSMNQLPYIFDHIPYRKGFSLLRMLESAVSDETFRKSLIDYIKENEFSNVDSEDFFRSVQRHTKEVNVSTMMAPWIVQSGYPLINTTRRGRNIILTQTRCLARKSDLYNSSESPYRYRWNIPIQYATDDGNGNLKYRTIYFDRKSDNVTIELANKTSWFKLNVNQTGFYRVNYPVEIWQQNERILNSNSTHLDQWAERANILDDAFSLANSGYILYDIPLSLVSYLKRGKEIHYSCWKVTARHFNDLKKKLQDTSASEKFIKYARGIIEPSLLTTLKKMNSIKETDHLDPVSGTILTLGCSLKHPAALKKVRALFKAFLAGESLKPYADIKSTIYRYGMGGDDEVDKWNKVWELYLQESDPHERNDLRKALVSVKNSNLLKRYLQLAKNESYVRSQDYLSILRTMAQKRNSNAIVWKFIRDEWEYLEKKYAGQEKKLGQVIQATVSQFNSEEKLSEVKEFFTKHPNASLGVSTKKRAQESINHNISWKKTNLRSIKNWLRYTLNDD